MIWIDLNNYLKTESTLTMNTYSNYYMSGSNRDAFPEGIQPASKYSVSVQDPQILRNVSHSFCSFPNSLFTEHNFWKFEKWRETGYSSRIKCARQLEYPGKQWTTEKQFFHEELHQWLT